MAKSVDTYVLVIQAPIIVIFVIFLLIICMQFVSPHFSSAYDTQCCQRRQNYKLTRAKHLYNTCGNVCDDVVHATAPHRGLYHYSPRRIQLGQC